MRLTLLHPDPERGAGTVTTDVDVAPGLAVADLRPALARVSGDPAWAGSTHRLAVADQVLDETHVSGQAPLVHGCVLSLGPRPRPPAEEAMRADWHVAVVAGPDCGALVALPDREQVAVGPGLTVRRRGDRVRARTGRRSRVWRPDTERTVGATTYALRPRTPRPQAVAPAPARPAVASWLAPAVGSAALAVALHQPLLALVGLVGPIGMVGAVRLRRRGPQPPGELSIADPAGLVAATVRARPDDPPARATVPWDAGGTVAVVGPRSLALPVARGVVLGALGTHLSGSLVVRSSRPQDWSWCAWAGRHDGLPGPDEEALVVVDDPPDPAALARWRSAAPPGSRVVVLAASTADVPAWCTSTIEVSRGSVRVHDPQGRVRTVPRHAVSPTTAEQQVRRAAGLRAARQARDDLPDRASLGAQNGIPGLSAAAVRTAWDRPRAGLVVPLGSGPGGQSMTVDLVADGPHALVAGTTGAGKSELLTTVVLALALTHPPERLSILLVDFKGGTGLGAVAGLPHVLEHVTDLDAAHAHRVLGGLRAELRRRERVLVAAGARDVADLDPGSPRTPTRLLVVVDELRALTEDVPEASAALARLAAQGRALGVHLLLATQRPAGAIGADLRANVSLRIALRVADAADSTDVLDAPDAAAIDPRTPGRALVRRGSRALEAVQVARAVTAPPVPPVRLAAPWGSSEARWTPTSTTRDVDAAPAWVAAATGAAVDRPTARPPWLPALPDVVTVADVAAAEAAAVGFATADATAAEVPASEVPASEVPAADVDARPGVALAVADLPQEQRRGAVRWDATTGHLLVLGGPRSGRSTTLVTVGLGALATGWAVHAVGLPDEAAALLRAGDEHGTLGSVLALDHAVETARLLELLDRPGGPPGVLLVDRVDLVLATLGELARGAGADRLTALWRAGHAGGAAVAATADVGAVAAQHAGAFRDRLVLPVADPLLDALAGVPAAFAGPRPTPGRAVHLAAGGAQLVQVAVPPGAARPCAAPDDSVVRIRPLPRAAPMPDRVGPGPCAGPWHVLLGPGGDDASPVGVDVARGLLIAGPPGSGRSTALAVVGHGLVRAGHPVLCLSADTPPPQLAGFRGTRVDDLAAVTGDVTLLVDDLDELEREHPDLLDGLRVRVVATSTSQAAAGAYRGVLPGLLRTRRLLVLDTHDAASAELVGPRARWLSEPGRRVVGRAALVVGREVTPVQVYGPL